MHLSLTNCNIYREVYLPTRPLEKKNNEKKKERKKTCMHMTSCHIAIPAWAQVKGPWVIVYKNIYGYKSRKHSHKRTWLTASPHFNLAPLWISKAFRDGWIQCAKGKGMGERLALVSVGDTQQQEPSNKVPDSSNGHLGGGGGGYPSL